ncbi:MAG: alpha/beta fold hydrolase [Nitrosomonas sp.]|nr:MAG: alpha/beta fold hydrolase [Nitrosomonas sp.]
MLTDAIPYFTEPYRPPTWLPDGNSQTIYPYLNKPKPLFRYRRERWELDDGDFVDVDWADGPDDAPLVVFFHGLEGDSSSHYILSTINLLQQHRWRSAVIHFRGCSGTPNRLARAYHAGDSSEIDWMLRRIHREYAAQQPVHVIGVSLGGNALLKWIGESGEHAARIVAGAATVSVPLDLAAAGAALDIGFNQVYSQHFLVSLKRKALQKQAQFPGLLNQAALGKCRTIYQFDNIVTAPLHGFRDTDEYWRISSSKQWLPHIRVPTLVVNARNDPFVPAASLPAAHQVSSAVHLEFPQQGGHAGFMQGPFPGKLDWLPQRVLSFFYHECR